MLRLMIRRTDMSDTNQAVGYVAREFPQAVVYVNGFCYDLEDLDNYDTEFAGGEVCDGPDRERANTIGETVLVEE